MIEFPMKTRVQGADGRTHMVVTGYSGAAGTYATDVYRARDLDDALDNVSDRWPERTEAYFDYEGTHDRLLATVVHWWAVGRLGVSGDWLRSVLKASTRNTLDAQAMQRQACGVMTWRDHNTHEQKRETA